MWRPDYRDIPHGTCEMVSRIAALDHKDKFFNVRSYRGICAVNFGFVASLLVIIVAVLSVFMEIPVVSNYAFWFAVGAYIILAGTAFD